MKRETIIHRMQADGEITIVVQDFRTLVDSFTVTDKDTGRTVETRTSERKDILYGFGETVRCATAHAHGRECAAALLAAKWGPAPEAGKPDTRRTLREELAARIDGHKEQVVPADVTPAEKVLE